MSSFAPGLLVAAVLVLGFLAVIAFLGFLAYRGLRGSREGGQGSTGNNLALGCVLAALGLFALLFLGGISAIFLFRHSSAQAAAEHRAARDAQRHAEARQAEYDEEHAEAEMGRAVDEEVHIGGSQHVRLRFELRGPTGAVEEDMVEKLRELACDATGVEWTIEVVPSELDTDQRSPYRTVELGGRVAPEALDEIEDEIRERLDELELPAGQSIEYKDTVLDH